MKKTLYSLMGVMISLFFPSLAVTTPSGNTAYDFSFRTLVSQHPISLKNFEGQVILIVNTASYCGFTGQYEGLKNLYNTYKEKGFVVIGVPSNDFAGQEAGSHEEISSFCELNYAVNFPMTSKEVVLGNNAHPFYIWARKTLGFGSVPKWNFHKY